LEDGRRLFIAATEVVTDLVIPAQEQSLLAGFAAYEIVLARKRVSAIKLIVASKVATGGALASKGVAAIELRS
jgi:hypothetical protein